MASDAAPVNGLYGGSQYNQPAELAASTPSASAHAPSASQSTTASAAAPKADPQEIGWYFVEQYYTTLSKSPEKIHLFYSKKSQLVSGVEADKVVPAVGTKAISEKIKALDFHECKVRVINVDSQSSYTNIVVQVIGEISNKSEPHHKFVQTFVLAEQPNGYFVLNDIFRYLKDEEDEIIEDDQPQEEQPVEEHPAEEPPTPIEGLPAVDAGVEDAVTTHTAVEEVDDKLQQEQEAAAPQTSTAEVNGTATSSHAESAEPAPETKAPEKPDEEETISAAPTPEPKTVPEPPTVAALEAPPAKKTWASMLGGGATKPPAVPALPVASAAPTRAVRPAQPAQAPKPAVEPATPTTPASSAPVSQSNGWQTADHSKKGKPQNRATDNIVLAYIKNVTEKMEESALRETLERYGELKYFDVSRPRNCAFVEFATPAGYAAATTANPHTVNGEQIFVEERRPRPDAYGGANNNFARGGGRNASRGGGRGGNFPKDGGRGAFQTRGGRPGNVTPKGRGHNAS